MKKTKIKTVGLTIKDTKKTKNSNTIKKILKKKNTTKKTGNKPKKGNGKTNGISKNQNFTVLCSFDGYVRLQSDVFHDTQSFECKETVNRLFCLQGIEKVKINSLLSTCLITYDPLQLTETFILTALTHSSTHTPATTDLASLPTHTKNIKLHRFGNLVSSWEIIHHIPGRLRVGHHLLYRNKLYCQHIEKLLFNTVAIEKYKSNPVTGTVLIVFDELKLAPEQLLHMLETKIQQLLTEDSTKDIPNVDFAVNTASLCLAAVGTYFFPVLLPLNLALVYYTAQPSFKGALQCIFKERRIGVDILDSIVTLACLLTGEVFAAALMVWCLGVGKTILDKTSDQSRKLLTEAFGKQPQFAWLIKDGQEVQVPIDTLHKGDLIAVNTGEQIPVDGQVHSGDAMIDQHTLTGESAPVEKRKGDVCYASTVVLSGVLRVEVKEAGENTTAAKIKQAIEHAANYKVDIQSLGESIADKAVLPTLGLASLGYATAGRTGALAIMNCDYGTGIRVAAPTALLTSLIVAAKSGILIKKGHVLENLSKVNTFIFDKTGTLTHEVPEVREIICNGSTLSENEILAYAAIAEQKFTHPIARAILKKAEERNLTLKTRDDTKYNIGFGIEVKMNDDVIKVGSHRYMEKEKIAVPSSIQKKIETIMHHRGGSAVMVALNNRLAGVLELESSHRAEAYDVIQGLKQRGVEDIVLISGDHLAPTKTLADKLGIKTFYSEVLPHDKLKYVKMFQGQGKKVAMIGDGINDSPALSKADVSISLRGASDIAVDVADVVFMDGDLSKINLLYDISSNLRKNVRRSFALIAIPNSICITGALFGAFGLTHSLFFNNGANLMATLNGTLPLAKVLEDKSKDEVLYAPKNFN